MVEAQILAHAAPHLGSTQLEQWATREAAGTGLEWREFFGGATASVVAVHALIAAAADHRTTGKEAVQIDTVYLSICAMTTMLDSLIDYEDDMNTGKPAHVEHYEDRDVLARQLVSVARHAAAQARALPSAEHHVMIIVTAAAYYTSAPTARMGSASPVTTRIQRELQPLITPTLALMHAWRLAKRVHRWAGKSSRQSQAIR